MQKTSQAALENLTTYAWALLAVLIALGALYYFNIFNIKDFFMPNQCTLTPGLACSDFVVHRNAAKIVFTNSLGGDVTITGISLKDCEGNLLVLDPSIKNNQKSTFVVGLCNIEGRWYSTELNVTYKAESGLEHKATGKLVATIEPRDLDYNVGDGCMDNSASCLSAGDCCSDNCIDGYCCNSACTGTCQACDVSGSLGTCTSIPANTDPDNECAQGSTADDGCAGNNCDGLGACQNQTSGDGGCPNCYTCSDSDIACEYYTAGAIDGCSGTYACSGFLTRLRNTCNGAGSCADVDAAAPDCSGTCASYCSSGSCVNTGTIAGTCIISTDARVISGGDGRCASSDCKPDCESNGVSCSTRGECCSGECIDGYCCNSACTGTCQACDVSGSLGTCTSIPADTDPDNECAQGSTADDGCAGNNCDGSGACQNQTSGDGGCPNCYTCSDSDIACEYYTAGAIDGCSGTYACSGFLTRLRNTCNGLGSCGDVDAAAGDCSGTCLSYCSSGSCINTDTSAGTCTVLTDARVFSGGDGRCTSGSCATDCSGCYISGTCYANGTANPANGCQQCLTSWSTSSWYNVGSGTDPYNYCAGSGCTSTGYCNGAGACQGTVPNGQDPNGACGAISCTSYFYGFVGDTCYYRANVADSVCDGSSSCQTAASLCPSQGQGSAVSSRAICQTSSGCFGTTAPSYGNVGAGSDTYNDCATTGCQTGNCDGSVACQYATAGTDPNNYCTAGSTSTNGCNSGNCGGGAVCQIATNGDSNCPNCWTCSDSDEACEYYPAGTLDGCLGIYACSGFLTRLRNTCNGAGSCADVDAAAGDCSGTCANYCSSGNCINTDTGAGTCTVSIDDRVISGGDGHCTSSDCIADCRSNGVSCSSGGECCFGNCYIDTDGDSYAGDSGTTTCRASASLGSDCDDSDGTKYQYLTCYTDSDGDGYGVGSSSQICSGASCPSGYSSNSNDCYDSNANAKPGQTGYYDVDRGDGSYDYNCDGSEEKSTYYCSNVDSCGVSGSCSGGCGSRGRLGIWGCGLTSCGQYPKVCELKYYTGTIQTGCKSNTQIFNTCSSNNLNICGGVRSGGSKASIVTADTKCNCI